MSLFKRKPELEYENSSAKFMHEGSAKEQKRFFKKVIEGAIQDQQAIIRRADEILTARVHNGNGKGTGADE